MNTAQELWWRQVRSDLATFNLLRRHGADPCQQLHYLQMTSEKLGKAYFCQPGHPPRRSHATFVPFLRALGSLPQARRDWTATLFAFRSYLGFQAWVAAALPIAYSLERLAPALAQDGPNPEYPWPQLAPVACPADHPFPIWRELVGAARGRQFIQSLNALVVQFPRYA